MDVRHNYETLIDEYKKRTEFAKKLGLSGGMMQFSAILIANSLKPLEMPYYKLIGPLFLLWAIYAFMKDFRIFLRIEKELVQIAVDGIALEKRNTNMGNYFHEVMKSFNFIKTLLIRSLVNLVAFGGFGYFLFRCIADLNPNFAVNSVLLVSIAAILTAFSCKLYYDVFKVLKETKKQVLVVVQKRQTYHKERKEL